MDASLCKEAIEKIREVDKDSPMLYFIDNTFFVIDGVNAVVKHEEGKGIWFAMRNTDTRNPYIPYVIKFADYDVVQQIGITTDREHAAKVMKAVGFTEQQIKDWMMLVEPPIDSYVAHHLPIA